MSVYLKDDSVLLVDDSVATDQACCCGGACCQDDGTCTIEANETACTDIGGTFQGVGTTCDPNPCMPPCCPTTFEHDGHFYLHKEVNITGTCHCGEPRNVDGSVNATSVGDIDPDTCVTTYSCEGSGEQPYFGHEDWQLHSGQCYWHDDDDGFVTTDPVYTLRCYEGTIVTCPAGTLIDAPDDCSQDFEASNCSAIWTVTVTYSKECMAGGFSPPP